MYKNMDKNLTSRYIIASFILASIIIISVRKFDNRTDKVEIDSLSMENDRLKYVNENIERSKAFIFHANSIHKDKYSSKLPIDSNIEFLDSLINQNKREIISNNNRIFKLKKNG